MPVLFGLWVLTGLAFVLTFMGMFSIGIFILPVAVGLLVVSIVLTTRRPAGWPALAGLGVSFAAGVAWLGWTVAGSARFDEVSCSGGSNQPTVCTSHGRVIDPDSVDWVAAAPWLGAAALIAVVSVVFYAVATSMTRSNAAMLGR